MANFKIISVAIFVVGFYIFANPVFAQDLDEGDVATISAQVTNVPINDSEYKQAFLDFNLSQESYRKSHEEYLLRRSQYLKFKTLTSQQDAYTATLDMLIKRDEVIIAYLTILREKVLIAEGVAYETKNRLDIALNVEKDWYINHKSTLTSAETLENLVSDSELASERYIETKIFIYEVLYLISDGRIEDFRIRLNDIISNIKSVKDIIKADERPEYQFSTRKIATVERFLLESENRMVRSSEQQSKAKETLDKFRGYDDLKRRRDALGVYNSMIISLSSSQQFFKEVSSFQKEILREIKTAE